MRNKNLWKTGGNKKKNQTNQEEIKREDFYEQVVTSIYW